MTVLYAGCSFTAGNGWDSGSTGPDGIVYFTDCKDNKNLWVNLLHNQLFGNEPLANIATGGQSNLRIFQTVAKCMLTQKYTHAFVQWTTPMRHEWSIGLESWGNTLQHSILGSKSITVNLHNNLTYPGDYIQDRFDRFFSLEHEHYRIVQLLEYVSILNSIAELTNTSIYFINGLCKWDKNFFTKVEYQVPSETTAHTQELIDLPNRDDKEYKILYNQIHNQYKEAGTILEDRWLNLYDSMEQNKIDTNNDNSHPGIQSNQNFTTTFLQAIKSKS